MQQCWESIRAETLEGGAADDPRTRRDAVVRHIEEWLGKETGDSRLLAVWRGMDERMRNLLLDGFSDPPPLDIIGFTCERCGALDPQSFDSHRQVCGRCGWVWLRHPER